MYWVFEGGVNKEKKFQATALWLKHNHQRFMSEEKRGLVARKRKSVELDITKKALLKEALAHFK